MYSIGKIAQVVAEMKRYNLDILGITESRWTDSGKIKTETIVYSGRQYNHHSSVVAIALIKETAKILYEWSPINDCITTARFWSKFVKTIVIISACSNK